MTSHAHEGIDGNSMFVLGEVGHGANAMSASGHSPVGEPNPDAWSGVCAERTEHLHHDRNFARIHSHEQVDHEAVRIDLETVDGDRDDIVLKHECIDREHFRDGAFGGTIPDGWCPFLADRWSRLRDTGHVDQTTVM